MKFWLFRETINTWKSFDKLNLTIGQFALHRILERRVQKMRLASAKVRASVILCFIKD